MVDGQNNEPLTGVNVFLTNSKRGTNTDIKREFRLTVNIGDLIRVSYIGYNDLETIITGATLTIKLQPKDIALEIGRAHV